VGHDVTAISHEENSGLFHRRFVTNSDSFGDFVAAWRQPMPCIFNSESTSYDNKTTFWALQNWFCKESRHFQAFLGVQDKNLHVLGRAALLRRPRVQGKRQLCPARK
jgi:hypothetical protein